MLEVSLYSNGGCYVTWLTGIGVYCTSTFYDGITAILTYWRLQATRHWVIQSKYTPPRIEDKRIWFSWHLREPVSVLGAGRAIGAVVRALRLVQWADLQTHHRYQTVPLGSQPPPHTLFTVTVAWPLTRCRSGIGPLDLFSTSGLMLHPPSSIVLSVSIAHANTACLILRLDWIRWNGSSRGFS